MAKGLNKSVTWLSLAHFTTDTYSGFLNPIMPFIAANLGISMGIAALIMSISQLISQLIQPVFGFFADNIFKREEIKKLNVLETDLFSNEAKINNYFGDNIQDKIKDFCDRYWNLMHGWKKSNNNNYNKNEDYD